MKKALIAIAVVIVAVGGWCVVQRAFQDDKQKIIDTFEEMRQAAERKSPDGIIKHFSNDYSDKDGNSKLFIYGIIKRSFQNVDEIRVKIEDVDVTVAGDRAWASCRIVLEATKQGSVFYPFGSDQDPETPTVTFAKTSTGNWQVIKVENVRSRGF